LAVAIVAGACSESGETFSNGTTTTSTTSTDPVGTLWLEPSSSQTTVDIAGAAASPVSFAAHYQLPGEAATEVTAEAEWEVSSESVATVSSGQVTPVGIGGDVTVTATYQGQSASATLTIQLVGDVFLPGTDSSTKDDFDAAGQDPETANAPAIEYPEDGAVLPGNLPPIEMQWSQADDNDVYRLRLSSPPWLEVAVYTTARELLVPADPWSAIGASAPDSSITIEVDGMGPAELLRTSEARSMIISADIIDESAIYVWQTSTGSFRVLDIIAGTDVPLPTDSPALGTGQPCSGCHRISRDGKRFAFSFNGSTFQIGTLAYDETQQSFLEQVAPQVGVRGTYATFNPLEDTTIAAMLLTVPDDVPQNTPGDVRLEMRDPDTNASINSNVADCIASLEASVGHGATMPDWSPDGSFVVFVAYDKDTHYVRELGDDVVLGSIVEASVSYDSGSFDFGAPTVLVAANPDDDPDTGANNFLPTIAPDGSAVAFNRAAGWWPIKTQQSLVNLSGQLMLVRRSDGQVFELVQGSNGEGTSLSSTWPQWAPNVGSRYAWLAYASERAYGHRLTTASPENALCGLVQGQQQCKQLWITAIDREKLASGTADPSNAPFWIPGQTLAAQYVSPQWTEAVLPPPR